MASVLVGGVVADRFPRRTVMVAGDVLRAACLLAMRLPAHISPPSVPFIRELRDGWDAFRSRRWVWSFVLYFAFSNLMFAAWTALGPIVADREFGGARAWGEILAGIGVGTMIGSVVATRVDPGRPLLAVALMEGLFAGSFLFIPIGMALWGPLASWIGVSTALALAFGLMIALLLALLALPETRGLPRAFAPPEAPSAVDQAA